MHFYTYLPNDSPKTRKVLKLVSDGEAHQQAPFEQAYTRQQRNSFINIVISSTKEASTSATIQSIMFLIDILWSIINILVKTFIEERLN